MSVAVRPAISFVVAGKKEKPEPKSRLITECKLYEIGTRLTRFFFLVG
jgi:hypothetical protein